MAKKIKRSTPGAAKRLRAAKVTANGNTVKWSKEIKRKVKGS